VQFRFDLKRTLQAVGEMLRQSPAQRMNYMRLLKLLYIADREMLAEHAHPITGDQAVAMQRGPVLSQTYDLLVEKVQDPVWAKCLKRDHFEVVLFDNPGKSHLSKDILKKLQTIMVRYQDLDEWDMVEVTHHLEEWRKNFPAGSTSAHPIPWEDALIAQKKEHLISEVEKDERASALFDEMCRG
jgi:uncharacterized phage-associated protein